MIVLLVEDEAHKRDELTHSIQNVLGIEPNIVDSVREAVIAVRSTNFDLIILDMALPTFSEDSVDSEDAGVHTKGHDQSQGGVEVLRALNSQKKRAKILIITQFHNFTINGVKVKLKDAQKSVLEKYNQDVVGALLYKYKSKEVLQKFSSILKSVKK